jgi:Ca-activated chloride channel family protein
MKRTALAAAVTLVVAASNIMAGANNPPAPAPTPAPAASSPAPPAKPYQDVASRKLSRREKKDRIKALGEKYRLFLQDVEPIMMPSELDTFLLLETDPQREIYITDFWRRRDVAQGTTNHSFRDEYYARLDEVKVRFKYVSSDRSRIYLIHGQPGDIILPGCDRLLQPIEIWKYGFIAGIGHDVRFLFYLPRTSADWRLWNPIGDEVSSLAELISEDEVATSSPGGAGAVSNVFYKQVSPGVSRLQFECKEGDELQRAIFQMMQNKTDIPKYFEPPKVNEEDVHKILRSVVLANPGAPKLPAELSVAYPARQGERTDAQMTILVPRNSVAVKDVNGTKTYSLELTGEVLKEGQLFENFRYRFDFPGDVADLKLPVVVERFLRPNEYKARLRVVDVNSGAEAILENDLIVPVITDSPDKIKQREQAATTVAALKESIESNETTLRIVPLPDDLVSGVVHIDTMAVGDAIKGVEFWVDGKKIMVKRQPPYTLDLDLGDVPQARRIRAIALDANNTALTGDEIIVNTGSDPFRVRITSPRVAIGLKGKTRVEMSVKIPEGKVLDNVQLFYNETPVATLYGPPYVQIVNLPPTEGVGYLRALATLKDDPTPPVEDVVMVNTPQFMEEVNVHLVELPTTVLSGGRPLTTLDQSAFKVFDEGKPVKLAKFEHVNNLPLSIGMAVDTSGSMQPRLAEAQKAGADFFQNVMKPGDKAFLVAFDSQAQLIQKWSNKLTDVNSGLSKLRAEESTALYDAVVYSLYNFLGIRGQRALILITDGRDTSSRFTYEQAVEYSRRAAVPIYAIGIGIRPTDVDVRYKLGRFCSETGGNVYYIDNAGDLRKIYGDIQNELRSQYILGFYPPEGLKPGGKWREVNVQVSDGKAKTIRGYYP